MTTCVHKFVIVDLVIA